MAGLSQHLFALGRPTLERQLAHPTVRGIANGDLEPARFRSWLVQDYLFLLDYVRLFALAAARAPDGETLGRLVDLAHSTFHDELSLHRAYAARFGLAEPELEATAKSPVCAAYTDFLLRTAATGDFAEVVAALLPCMWGYSEIGRALQAAERAGLVVHAARARLVLASVLLPLGNPTASAAPAICRRPSAVFSAPRSSSRPRKK